jgi:GNAT superfamily N-acetyltransferase
MPLPILTHHPKPTNDDLVRFYHRCELHWVRQAAEETSLECGSAFTNSDLPNVYDANLMQDAFVAEGKTPADAVAEVEAHFSARGVRCHKWTINPSVPAERTAPLIEHLLSLGYTRSTYDLMYLAAQPAGPIREAGGLQIIPARASFRHARVLQEESAAQWKEPQVVEAAMLHLEDPQTDALLALKDGVAAGFVSVLAVGELGYIADVYVAEKFRRQGVGRTLMSRALEICARSLFKHVFLGVDSGNNPAVDLYKKFGFRRIAPYSLYRAPQARP